MKAIVTLTKDEQEFLNNIKHDTLKLITKVEELEQKIINLNAKHKYQINEIMLMFETINVSLKKKEEQLE